MPNKHNNENHKVFKEEAKTPSTEAPDEIIEEPSNERL